MKSRIQPPLRGIVLVIVLTMLSLFSVLVVSYVIFSSEVVGIANAAQANAANKLPVGEALNSAVASLVHGSSSHHSAAYHASILEDIYGSDGMILRVGNHRVGATTPSMPVNANGLDSRPMLLKPLNAQQQPLSTLFKLPTSLAAWHHDGTAPPAGALSNVPVEFPNFPRDIDDALSGRLLTFIEGPLQNETFRIVRSFGGSNANSPSVPTDVEDDLAGSVVIDLSQMESTEIVLDGNVAQLYVTARLSPGRLTYDLGADGLPGRGGFDDDGDSRTDEDDEIGYPGSDDFGHRFVVNGTPFNGKGQNPVGMTGLARNFGTPQVIDSRADIELQFNTRLTGATAYGGDTSQGLPPQPDEPWDAADFETIFLAWQPSDHRSVINGAVYSGGGSAELNAILGSHLIPSFHRPEVINYLMNAPIPIGNEDPATVTRTFADMDGSDPNDPARLLALVHRLRRATIRPLNVDHVFGDMDGDGDVNDGTPGFTGSNPVPVLSETLAATGTFAVLKDRVFRLGLWLVNGPWDVDNDGDGLPDSVWIDLNLPTYVSETGEVVRPLIAPLIEDLDSRININEAGNYRQIATQLFNTSNPVNYSTDAEYFAAGNSLNVFGRGGGVGPAELNFSHLFDENNPIPVGHFGPIYRTQTSTVSVNPLLTRYGNLLNTRYGGSPLSYTANVFPAGILKYPGFGDTADVTNLHAVRDQLARIPHPARSAGHSYTSVMGKPMDLSGVSMERKDRNGNELFDNLAASSLDPRLNEVINQPYEQGLSDDQPFSIRDFVALITNQSDTREIGAILGDELQRNQSLRNLITAESRSVDVPETTGFDGIVAYFSSKVNSATPAEKQIDLYRMIAPEFRKGAKLNINRALGNGQDDGVDPTSNLSGLSDESYETGSVGLGASSGANVIDRHSRENAFPQIANEFPTAAVVRGNYAPVTSLQLATPKLDFDGFDRNGNGTLDAGEGFDHDGDGIPERVATGDELLARHLYCLMMMVITQGSPSAAVEWVPQFAYPPGFKADVALRNKYVARRIAQWAANAVDARDTDAICTRLRYDPNPFDGFALDKAAENVVWGMERPEIEISETMAIHDKRLRRNLTEQPGANATLSVDGELMTDEDTDPDPVTPEADKDLDQFRIPEASTFVELRSLRSFVASSGTQPSFPAELYTNNQLDLGRVVGQGVNQSPVWRLAVGEPVAKNAHKSIRWLYDAERIAALAKDHSNTEQIDYLNVNAPANWANPDAELTLWKETFQGAAEVVPSISTVGEFVAIADDDFDPKTNGDDRIALTRFVWFANLKPSSTLNVIQNARSGMKLENVFYNRPDPVDSTDVDRPMNGSARLSPGQFAVVGPRVTTLLGQTTATVAPTFQYNPSPQSLNYTVQTASSGKFRFDYQDLGGSAPPETPLYENNGSGTPAAHYHVNAVVPIIAQSLYPHEVDPARTDWDVYVNNIPVQSQVALGFNISAPLPGLDYYRAPAYRISNAGPTGGYPLVDGYRDYAASVGFHPDEPFDHRGLGGAANAAPLAKNGWAGVGTHQEAVGIFLQRLANPTIPWHPIDNPYISVDLAPVDLTTMNGEEDPAQQIDRAGDGNMVAADDATTVTGGVFDPPIRFDSRRKIPDTKRDRAASDLVQRGTNVSNLASYERQVFTERPALSASFSLLKDSTPKGSAAVWDFELGAMWTSAHAPNDTGIDSSYRVAATWFPFHPRMDMDPYRQTFGFINREYGRPIGADNGGQDAADVSQYGRGTPRGTRFIMPQWDDRDFQSPVALLQIPAVSQTGLLSMFSPGTTLQDDGKRELPTYFGHTLGWDKNFAKQSATDLVPLGHAPLSLGPLTAITGDHAPIETVLDFVTTGETSYLNNHWLDPTEVKYISDNGSLNVQDRMFNRIVEFLQPPYNYIPLLRTPGRINVNTTPDYVRKSATFSGNASTFLDAGEVPENNTQTGGGSIGFSPIVTDVTDITDLQQATSSPLFGNGSVYRSFGWSMSDFYDLDDNTGKPAVLGQSDNYGRIVDTRFGHEFKGFIESRRGYDSTLLSSRSTFSLFNPDLDWRYPTRFGGMFAPATAAEIPSVRRFMGSVKDGTMQRVQRRTHDMSLLRPHPDFDERAISGTNYTAVNQPTNTTAYSLNVETDPTGGSVTLPAMAGAPAEVTNLRMVRANQGLFDRSIADLHKEFRHLARDPSKRYENASRLKNLTTHHSNVFMVRMTVGFFIVDPATGAIGAEYENAQGLNVRGTGIYVIDRSIPVGFLRGEPINHHKTITFAATSE